MKRFSRTVLAALTAFAAFSGLGCGSAPTTTPTPTPTPVETRLVQVFSISPSTVNAVGGESITIIGSGFSGRTTLRVTSPPVTGVTVVSDTEIRATMEPTAIAVPNIQREVIVIGDGISSAEHSPTAVYLTIHN